MTTDSLKSAIAELEVVADALSEHRKLYGPEITAEHVESDLRRIIDKWSR